MSYGQSNSDTDPLNFQKIFLTMIFLSQIRWFLELVVTEVAYRYLEVYKNMGIWFYLYLSETIKMFFSEFYFNFQKYNFLFLCLNNRNLYRPLIISVKPVTYSTFWNVWRRQTSRHRSVFDKIDFLLFFVLRGFLIFSFYEEKLLKID